MSDVFELGLNEPVESNQSTLSLLDIYSGTVLPSSEESTPKATTVGGDTTGEGNAVTDTFWQDVGAGLHEFSDTGVKHALLSTMIMNNAMLQMQPGRGYPFFLGTTGVVTSAVSLMNLSQDAPKLFSADNWSAKTQYGLQTTGDLLMLGGGIGMMIPQIRTGSLIAEYTGIGVRWLTPLFFPDEKK